MQEEGRSGMKVAGAVGLKLTCLVGCSKQAGKQGFVGGMAYVVTAM